MNRNQILKTWQHTVKNLYSTETNSYREILTNKVNSWSEASHQATLPSCNNAQPSHRSRPRTPRSDAPLGA